MSTIQPVQPYFQYNSLYIDKHQLLGYGLYCEVYNAMCDQLPCAAKILHNHPERNAIIQRLQEERILLNSIRHPHIVQFLDIVLEPESKLPVILTELLDESLTHLLQNSREPLPYHVQVAICHDTALAVAYLHSRDIIHRDLSSNNVLVIAGRRAKVADFGMFGIRVIDDTSVPIMTSLTVRPGSLLYMPPEALHEPPQCTKKLDCYSLGVIMIQIHTRQLPNQEERLKHLRDVNSAQPLLTIAKKCLSDDVDDRPSAIPTCAIAYPS